MSPARRNDLVMLGVAAVVLALDQLTKHWIVAYFTADPSRGPISLVGDILQLENDANKGVAFSLLYGSASLFLFIGLALAVIGVLYWRLRDTASPLLKVAFGLILGGAFGNLLDRLTRGYVVDFIHFQVQAIHFDFAVFNVADSGISIGVVLLAFLLWRGEPKPKTADRLDGERATFVSSASAPAAGASPTPRVRRRIETSR